MSFKNFLQFDRVNLEKGFQDASIPSVHARKVFSGFYRDAKDWETVCQLAPKRVSSFLAQFECPLPKVLASHQSPNVDSTKLVLELEDGARIETVIIREKTRTTVCVSSQVGCKMACTFCATGRMGLIRSLSSGEIASQLLLAKRFRSKYLSHYPEITNLVFMGMGEPLDNPVEVFKAIRMFIDPLGFALAPRRVSLSTVGPLDGLRAFLKEDFNIKLAYSLHESSPKRRTRIVPSNRQNPVEEALELLKHRDIFIQYTVISGVNDHEANAVELCQLLQGRRVKVNLIPLNPVSHSRFETPDIERVSAMQESLLKSGIRTTIRFSKGRDTEAACGQLVQSISVQI